MAVTDFHSCTVLVADPSPYMAKMLGSILSSLEVGRIIVRSDEGQIKTLLKDIHFDCLFMEWFGQGAPNLDLVTFARRDPDCCNPELPIIVCTGYTDYDRIIAARDRGATEIIAKPVCPQQVAQKLKAVLTHKRPFVVAEEYVGPDRRRQQKDWDGEDRRTNTQMSQGDIDALMNTSSTQSDAVQP